MVISRRVIRKILPPGLYRLVASKVYLPLWEIGWRLGLMNFALNDICQNERAIEYSWALRHIGAENGRVLDVGCKGSLFPVVLASLGFEVWGIDIEDIGKYRSRHPNFKFVQGDVRTAPLPENYFDAITIISTIEHVGLEDDGDIECLQRLSRLLADKGRIILTTPFGSPARFPRSRVYDRARLERICRGLRMEKTGFYRELDEGKWTRAAEAEVTGTKHTWEKVHSIACLVAVKEGQ
jgi:2-polyprenyl-3-methyl-5-hydroxy-6-metoxy-1,4-benzoquinol methylase